MSARRRAYCHNFNPRSPDGERRMTMAEIMPYFNISIHAPRMGSDVQREHALAHIAVISIHAPRMGSDPHVEGQ